MLARCVMRCRSCMMHCYSCRPGKLAPLAPLGGGGGGGLGAATRPLKSSGGGGDIKDELRRAGLLTLPDGDSYSGHSSVEVSAGGSQPPLQRQQQARPARAVYDAEFSVSNSNIEDMLGGAQVRSPGSGLPPCSHSQWWYLPVQQGLHDVISGPCLARRTSA